MKKKDITREDIERVVGDSLYGKIEDGKSTREPSITHYEWEEDGKNILVGKLIQVLVY